MKEKNKDAVFSSFIAKAAQRIDDKKTHKTCNLYIPSLDETITVRGLSNAELASVMEVEDKDDVYASDKYAVYLAAVSPDLKEIAKSLKEEGKILEYTDVCEMFELHEVKEISTHIMKLSGVTGENKVEVVKNDLKN